jgi:protein transport protein SEC61 subunit alpha
MKFLQYVEPLQAYLPCVEAPSF